jgi:hypothetical protein
MHEIRDPPWHAAFGSVVSRSSAALPMKEAAKSRDRRLVSAGADRPRTLRITASADPTQHVLDWFHLAVRIQHVA